MNIERPQAVRGKLVAAAWIALRAAMSLWALFWTWFALVDGYHDAIELGPVTYLAVAGVLLLVWTPFVLAWRRARLGAVAMAIGGSLALLIFRGPILGGPQLAFALLLACIAWLESRGTARTQAR